MKRFGVVCLALAGAVGCKSRTPAAVPNAAASSIALPAGTQTLSVAVGRGTLTTPESAPPGWVQLQVAPTDSASHVVAAFALPRGVEPATFVAALNTEIATPLGAEALGGSETTSSNAIIAIDSGRVLIGCLSRDAAGKRHAASGEWKVVSVGSRSPLPPPPNDVKVDVALNNFAFTTASHWPAGAQLIQVRNTGTQDHHMMLARLHPGANLGDFMNAKEGTVVTEAPIGVSRISPVHSALLPVTLQPGHYVLYCLITDPASKKQHIELGMMKEIVVDAPAA